MAITIKPLGITEEEFAALDKAGIVLRKNVRRMHEQMLRTPGVTDDDLDELEAVVGALPLDYRSFLKQYNGGKPFPNEIVVENNELVVNCFFALKCPPRYSESLYAYRENYVARVPRGMLPIASSGGGDLILLNLGARNYGEIYYWYHELECETDAFDYYENVEWLANSFDEFLNKLCDLS